MGLKLLTRLKAESRLLFQYLTVIAVLLFMIVISASFASRIVHGNITLYGEAVITSSAETLTAYLNAHQIAFDNVAFVVEDLYSQGADTGTISGELEKLSTHLTQEHDEIYKGFLYIYAIIDGEFVQSFDRISADYKKELPARPWYVGALEKNGETYFSDPYNSLQTEEYIMSLSKILYDKNNNPFGVMAFDIHFDTISDYVNQIRLMNTGYGALLDSELRIIVHAEESILGIRLDDLRNEKGDFSHLAASLREGHELAAYRTLSFAKVDSIY